MIRTDFLLVHSHISIFPALFEITFCDLILDTEPASIKFGPNVINFLQHLSKISTPFVLFDRIGVSNRMSTMLSLFYFTSHVDA